MFMTFSPKQLINKRKLPMILFINSGVELTISNKYLKKLKDVFQKKVNLSIFFLIKKYKCKVGLIT